MHSITTNTITAAHADIT